jgi:hypothetical protein
MNKKIIFFVSDENLDQIKKYAKVKSIGVGTLCRLLTLEKINEVVQK